MANVPLSASNISILRNVPFNRDRKHTRWFSNATEQRSYFSSMTSVMNMANASTVRMEGKHYISVSAHIDDLWQANYLTFKNKDKWFYAFITKLEYKNKSTTWVWFELDSLQTFMFNVTFRPSFIVREHENDWTEGGDPSANNIDEGIDYGDVYDTKRVDRVELYRGIFFLVIVSKEAIHTNGNGEVTPTNIGTPQPLSYYVLPYLANGNAPEVSIGDTSGVAVDKFDKVLKGIYKIESAPNNIVSLYVTEFPGLNISNTSTGIKFTASEVDHATIQDDAASINLLYVKNAPQFTEKEIIVSSNKYAGLRMPTNAKLLTSPYAHTLVTDFKGNQLTIKNEHIKGNSIVLKIKGSLGTSNKYSVSVKNYNQDSDNLENASPALLLDAYIDKNPNDVPIITDMLSAYLQGNRNSIQNQTDSIMFNWGMSTLSTGIGAITSAASRDVSGAVGGITGAISGTGNSILQLQGISAKQKDIDNTPPSISNMGGNTAFDLGNGLKGIYIVKQQIKPLYFDNLEQYFNMYGVKRNRIKVPNLRTRTEFNYVQTLDCNITGQIPNDAMDEIKSTFNGGITLWHVNNIQAYDGTNAIRR